MNRPLTSPKRGSGSFRTADNVRELGAGIRIEDAELVQQARGGDRWAEEVLYHRHVSYIMGMVVRCLGDQNDAEDVVQDTFAIGLDRLGPLRQPEAGRSELPPIATRLVGALR